MNTRGLTELIVLNLALEKGVISRRAVRRAGDHGAGHDVHGRARCCACSTRSNEFGAPVEEELEEAKRAVRAPTRPCRCPSARSSSRRRPTARSRSSLALAEPLAQSEPPRELILARVAAPAARRRRARRRCRPSSGCSPTPPTRPRRRGSSCSSAGMAARSVALHLGATPGRTWCRLVDGRGGRPRARGRPSPAARRGRAAGRRRCAAARGARATWRCSWRGSRAWCCPGPTRRCSCPSAGPSTTGRRSSSARGWRRRPSAPLQLLGTAEGRAAPAAANASLLVQRFAGVTAEPVLAEPGEAGIVEAAARAPACS